MEFRVVYDYSHPKGKHQYIIEQFSVPFYISANPFRRRKKEWNRFGGGYFFDDREEAIRQCDNLNGGKIVVYPKESA